MISGSFGMQKKIAASFKDIFEADDCDDTDTILRCKRLVGNTQKTRELHPLDGDQDIITAQ